MQSIVNSLYRKEAIEAQALKGTGAIVLARPLSFSVIAWAAAFAAALLVGFACVTHYTKRTRLIGYTQPEKGALKLVSPQPGLLVERRVSEGQAVRAGEVLFVVSGERITASDGLGAHAFVGQQLRARRDSLGAEIDRQQRLSSEQRAQLLRRLADLQAEIETADRETGGQTRRLELVRERHRRYADLQQSNFLSAAALQERQEEILDHEQRLLAQQRGRISLIREAAQVRSELAQLPLRTGRELATLERSAATLEQELALTEAQRQSAVVAPVDGVITGILAETGQTVGSTPLATLLPADSQLEAVLFVPSRAAGFIETGQVVRVRYSSYPYQKFGQHEGTVTQVSRTPLAPQEFPTLLAGYVQSNEPLVRVTVRLAAQTIVAYGQQHVLSPGMQLEADVMQDRRRLIEWMLEPLFTLKGKA